MQSDFAIVYPLPGISTVIRIRPIPTRDDRLIAAPQPRLRYVEAYWHSQYLCKRGVMVISKNYYEELDIYTIIHPFRTFLYIVMILLSNGYLTP